MFSNYQHRYTFSYQATTHLNIEDGVGGEAFVAFDQSRRLGWELSAGDLSFDGRLEVVDDYFPPGRVLYIETGAYAMQPILLTFVVRIAQTNRYNVALGPLVGWTRYKIDIPDAQKRDSELTYGLKAGIEVRVRDSRWFMNADVRYLKTEHDTTDRDLYGSLAFPATSLGVAYHF